MHRSNVYTGGQALAAAGIILGLALTVPLLGIVMIPVAGVGTVARMIAGAQGTRRLSAEL
jgi:hypothetical protein